MKFIDNNSECDFFSSLEEKMKKTASFESNLKKSKLNSILENLTYAYNNLSAAGFKKEAQMVAVLKSVCEDPSMEGLDSDRMLKNLEEKGWVFNADDGRSLNKGIKKLIDSLSDEQKELVLNHLDGKRVPLKDKVEEDDDNYLSKGLISMLDGMSDVQQDLLEDFLSKNAQFYAPVDPEKRKRWEERQRRIKLKRYQPKGLYAPVDPEERKLWEELRKSNRGTKRYMSGYAPVDPEAFKEWEREKLQREKIQPERYQGYKPVNIPKSQNNKISKAQLGSVVANIASGIPIMQKLVTISDDKNEKRMFQEEIIYHSNILNKLRGIKTPTDMNQVRKIVEGSFKAEDQGNLTSFSNLLEWSAGIKSQFKQLVKEVERRKREAEKKKRSYFSRNIIKKLAELDHDEDSCMVNDCDMCKSEEEPPLSQEELKKLRRLLR